MNSIMHARSAAKRWGGTWENYIDIEEFIDSSKKIIGDVRHRSVYHHTEGVWLCQMIFGRTLLLPRAVGEGFIEVPVRLIAEQHILEDLGWLPSPADYIEGMPIETWMSGSRRREVPLSHVLRDLEEKEDQAA